MSNANVSRARAALLALPLLASGLVLGVQVTRSSLLGFRVGTEILEVEEAAARLATLVWRTRGALANAAARLRSLRIAGTFSMRPSFTLDGRPCVRVRVRITSEMDFAARDEHEALVEASLSCRDAFLYAHVEGNEVFVCG